ncbi:MAG: hypothetical protein J0I21_06990 [Alphaproteobacteria bacterium]|nr:hypothetical protein [Alphaproteobacteria bacterium]
MTHDALQAWEPTVAGAVVLRGEAWPEAADEDAPQAGSAMTALVNLLVCVCALTETMPDASPVGAGRGCLPGRPAGPPLGALAEAPELRFVRFACTWPDGDGSTA